MNPTQPSTSELAELLSRTTRELDEVTRRLAVAEASANLSRELGPEPPFGYTVAMLAVYFDRSPHTVRDWIRAGELAVDNQIKGEYRITRAAVEAFIAEMKAASRPPKPLPRRSVDERVAAAVRSPDGARRSTRPSRHVTY